MPSPVSLAAPEVESRNSENVSGSCPTPEVASIPLKDKVKDQHQTPEVSHAPLRILPEILRNSSPEQTKAQLEEPGSMLPDLPKSPTRKRRTFWEIFSGFCGLSMAVGAIMMGAAIILAPLDYDKGHDLLLDDVYNNVSSTCQMEGVDWLAMAPPCRTFTKSRR